jgi:hypothetical protein
MLSVVVFSMGLVVIVSLSFTFIGSIGSPVNSSISFSLPLPVSIILFCLSLSASISSCFDFTIASGTLLDFNSDSLAFDY